MVFLFLYLLKCWNINFGYDRLFGIFIFGFLFLIIFCFFFLVLLLIVFRSVVVIFFLSILWRILLFRDFGILLMNFILFFKCLCGVIFFLMYFIIFFFVIFWFVFFMINVLGSLFVLLFGILIIVVFFMVEWEMRRVLSLVGGIWIEIEIVLLNEKVLKLK